MSDRAVLETSYSILDSLISQFHTALDGIPDNDLNVWKPAAEANGGGEMNTLAALCVHVVAAARWRIEQQLLDREYVRHREREFEATASRAEIDEQFATLLSNFREAIDSGIEVELNSLPTTIRDDHPDWTRLDWLTTAISHTALHLGHAQIHRQLWLAERGNTA